MVLRRLKQSLCGIVLTVPLAFGGAALAENTPKPAWLNDSKPTEVAAKKKDKPYMGPDLKGFEPYRNKDKTVKYLMRDHSSPQDGVTETRVDGWKKPKSVEKVMRYSLDGTNNTAWGWSERDQNKKWKVRVDADCDMKNGYEKEVPHKAKLAIPSCYEKQFQAKLAKKL